jgi:hypothetical protein
LVGGTSNMTGTASIFATGAINEIRWKKNSNTGNKLNATTVFIFRLLKR